MLEEKYVDIYQFEKLYQISNFGNVRNKINGKLLKPFIVSNRYYGVTLYKDKKKTYKRVHRLVAEHFLPLDEIDLDKWVVNHKDLNRFNNYVDNLEWMKQVDNVRYYFKNDYYINKKFKEQDQMEMEREKSYEKEAETNSISIGS